MSVEYCCHDHGVIGEADSLMESDRPRACPVCDSPVFFALGAGLPSAHGPRIAWLGGEATQPEPPPPTRL